MNNEWISIYQSYAPDKLQEEIEWLQRESRNLYVSAGVGTKNYQRAFSDIKNRLEASIWVKKSRGSSYSNDTVVDCSGL
jgi:hypothetical protein